MDPPVEVPRGRRAISKLVTVALVAFNLAHSETASFDHIKVDIRVKVDSSSTCRGD